MALKDIWVDLENAIPGVAGSGSAASAENINNIAHAVIDVENDYMKSTDMDSAVISAITNNSQELTDEQQWSAQEWLGGEMIIRIKPNANREYIFKLHEMIYGMYYLPAGTQIWYNLVDYKVYENDVYIIVTGTASDSTRSYIIFNIDDGQFAVGKGNRNNMGLTEYSLDDFPNKNMPNTFLGIQSFSLTPKILEEIPIESNDNSITTTQWVNSKINNAIGDIETALDGIIALQNNYIGG